MVSPTAKRRFSQNFLRDPHVIEEIIGAGSFSSGDKILEIGPGYGALTQELLKNVSALTAIEVDRDAVHYLRSRFAAGHLRVIEADCLDVNLSHFGVSLRLLGNLPYHISTPILFHVDAQIEYIQDAIFMLQREVVDRIVAAPGSAEYGKLSITLQLGWELEKLFDVPPEAFQPMPKVWSSILHLRPRVNPHNVNRATFQRIVFGAFSKRRKTLRNALKGIVSIEQFILADIDPAQRPETLSVDDYVRLSKVVFKD
ncbi:MAG: 16S rRNA (adenine(1518)-N(6)/adenine(1519)-N(6))-dimethyltransferase RsmA [Proteobacteria bacterium]|nr:16S rRNA (adenine(1518)-N(6)/adenine(1519)-N(6))-dimethyltransferase RsmA [Pseudomonadota bacterium]MDA0861998.1 16S rRNA (adenine(1518)-N(6)/adenine(1519)-N(6))-dimethyltransferase RsmA [Pseudomonadota bacterium]MDA1031449.1 16S rRNA (adenine(1518)-N(6)/adenine(1519)-N(6))-dimethyltransferase RsmA [Pseudomonadota bacterium]